MTPTEVALAVSTLTAQVRRSGLADLTRAQRDELCQALGSAADDLYSLQELVRYTQHCLVCGHESAEGIVCASCDRKPVLL